MYKNAPRLIGTKVKKETVKHSEERILVGDFKFFCSLASKGVQTPQN